MDAEEVRMIGKRLMQLRKARGKSLRVLADLTGIGRMILQRIESGERAVITLSEIVVLADALQIAPSELTRLPVPAPANGHTDSAIHAVERALTAASQELPGGQILPAELLRARVVAAVEILCDCDREREVATLLPDLIRDIHASIGTGRETGELLPLAAWLHSQVTAPWLRLVGAPLALCSLALALARRAAGEHDTPGPWGLVAVSAAWVALAGGSFDLAQASLDAVTVPTTTPELMQLAGHLALRQSVVAAADHRLADTDASLAYATELAERSGGGNAYGLGFGPVNVGLFQVAGLVTCGDYERAVSIAESLNPESPTNQSQKASYWGDYGRALARVRGRHEDAVWAFRRAELISPHRVQRNPIARDVLGELLPRVRRDSPAGRELRRMAYRAGLPA